MERLGLIAGPGELPGIIAARASELGNTVVVIRAIQGSIPNPPPTSTVYDIFVGEWDRIVKAFKDEGVTRAYMAGKFSREQLYGGGAFDARFQSLVASLRERNDDSLVQRFIEDLEDEGITVGTQLEYLDHLCFGPGVLTRQEPTPSQWRDIARGYELAKGIAGLDAGQTAVVKEGGVLALEAIDGTDRTIRRGCELGHGGAVVVKVAKPNQDLRFDVPTVGRETLASMAQTGGAVLAIESDITLVVEGRHFVALAEELGIAVVSYAPGLEARNP